jgi:hypothetical protein
MYSCVEDYDFSDHDSTAYLRRRFDVDRSVIQHAVEESPPREGEFKRLAITAEHHTHYRPEEIWAVAAKHKIKHRVMRLVLRRLRQVEGITEAVVATFLAYCLTSRLQVSYMLATSRTVWAAKNVDQLAATLKELATPIKSMHNYEVCDLTELFELQCLVNRGIGTVNWEAERHHRTKPDTIQVPLAQVRKYAKEIFQMGKSKGYMYKTMDLEKYLDSRWEWAPGGSVHSQYESDKNFIPKEYRHKTKFVTLNMMGKDKLRQMMTRPAEIHAWASVKYEWAKQRAIYGVDLTSTLITNFAMYRCEEVFKHRFPVGEEAAATRVHKRLKLMLQDNESFCYDFDDFNAQHSTPVMQEVLKAYFECFINEMSPSQQTAMEWVINSLNNVTVHNNNDGNSETYRAKGTLLSGWRLTTFMNTALNYIYFKIAGSFGVSGVTDSVHNGDDVLVAIKNIKSAVMIHDRMAAINARAQPAKCNVYSVGEFLRVEHKVDKDKGLGAQYLTRACATLVHSRCESQEPVRITEAVKAVITRASELEQRCKVPTDLIHDLVDGALKRLADIFKKPIAKVRRMVDLHVLVGGSSVEKFACIDELLEEKFEYEETPRTYDADEVSVHTLLPGIIDYARALKRAYGDIINEETTVGRVMAATRRQISVTRNTWLVSTPLSPESKYRFGRALYRMYAEVVSIPHLEKARFVGISPIALLDDRTSNLVKSLLADADDVNYVMRVLF